MDKKTDTMRTEVFNSLSLSFQIKITSNTLKYSTQVIGLITNLRSHDSKFVINTFSA